MLAFLFAFLFAFLLAWAGAANPALGGVPVAAAFFLIPLGGELYALFGV